MSIDHTSSRKDLTNLSREELLKALKEMDTAQLLETLNHDHYKKYGIRPR